MDAVSCVFYYTLSAPRPPPSVYTLMDPRGSALDAPRFFSLLLYTDELWRVSICFVVYTLVRCAQRVECNVYYTAFSFLLPARNDGLPGISRSTWRVENLLT